MDWKEKTKLIQGNVIKITHNHNCQHNEILVDDELAYVECGLCGEKLNPIWVLKKMCNREHRAIDRIERLNDLAEKAIKKNRCKCEKCGKMTRIQR